jgi:hypothetical protein
MVLMAMRRRHDPRLADCTVDAVLESLGQSTHARASFWNPVAVATLNETPERAAAGPFVEVLARAFFRSRADSQFVLPRVGLGDLYTDDARRFVECRGGRVWIHAQAAALDVHDGAVQGVVLRDGRRLPADACVAPCRRGAGALPAARPACAAGVRAARRARDVADREHHAVVRSTRATRRLPRPARHEDAVGVQPHTSPRRGRSGTVRERRHQRRATSSSGTPPA